MEIANRLLEDGWDDSLSSSYRGISSVADRTANENQVAD